MAFAGTFIGKIKRISYGTSSSNSVTSELMSHHPNSFFYNVNRSNSKNSPMNNNSDEYTQTKYPAVLASDLTSLTINQRNIFITLLTILFVLSMCGNTCTLYVNFRRKIRPFFRACLISLAFSDLMNTVFITTAYLSQYSAEYIQIWRLGDLMCSLVPFTTTTTILAGSMTLVGIAVDRYFALMKAVIGFWNPSIISCIVCVFCIWLTSIGISCPVFTIYSILPVYILTEKHKEMNATDRSITAALTAGNGLVMMVPEKPNINATVKPPLPTDVIATEAKSTSKLETSSYILVREMQLVNICVSEQKNITLYYVIVFFIIFIPCLGAFFWFNSIIARKLWKRRYVADISKKKTFKTANENKQKLQTNMAKTLENPKTDQATTKNCNCKSDHISNNKVSSSLATSLGSRIQTTTITNSNAIINSSREARHLRMFTIILLMMAVFMFLRLPAWIFLLMRIYGNCTKPINWILYFVFGLMNLTSSVLNPLFYTFLTETIQYTLRFKAKVQSILRNCYGRFRCCCCYHIKYYCRKDATLSSPHNDGHCDFPLQNNRESWHSMCCYKYFCCCKSCRSQIKTTSSVHHAIEKGSKDSGQIIENDKDEGVDCSDEVVNKGALDFLDYNQRIYTIFPHPP